MERGPLAVPAFLSSGKLRQQEMRRYQANVFQCKLLHFLHTSVFIILLYQITVFAYIRHDEICRNHIGET